MAPRSLVCLSGLFIAGFVLAMEPPQDLLSKLRNGGEVTCRPSLPYFCANMHVACAGRTGIPTFPLSVRAPDSEASVQAIAPDSSRQALFERPTVFWDSQGTYLLLRPGHGKGYLRIHASGHFVLRHYLGPDGVMSLGVCE